MTESSTSWRSADWGYNIKVFLGDGLGGFHLSSVMNGDGEPIRVRLADLDKDGNLDILADGPAGRRHANLLRSGWRRFQ